MSARKRKLQAKTRKTTPRVREATAVYPEAAGAAERPVRKNLRLRQSRIDEARRVLGTSTETETIEAALDLVVFRHELVAGVESMRGTRLEDLFGDGL